MIALSASYETINIDGVKVTTDVSLLAETNEMAFNASDIATAFNKDVENFLRLNSTKEYIQAIIQDEDSPLNKISDFVQYRKGEYPGIYLIDELAFEFAGFCSNLFRRNLQKWVEERFRNNSIRLDIFANIPKNKLRVHDPIAFYHDFLEEHMISEIILGEEQFETLNSDYEDKEVRDYMTSAQLSAFYTLQLIHLGLIAIGMGYEERKEHLSECYRVGLGSIVIIE